MILLIKRIYLSERLTSFGIMGTQLRTPGPEKLGPSQYHRIDTAGHAVLEIRISTKL